MIKQYLDEILDGTKTFDARAYDTNKRGTIALIDSRSMKVYGLIDLVGTHKISAREYCDWHATGRWQGLILEVPNMEADYYAYDFINPRKLDKPIKVDKAKKTWVEIDDIER